MLIDSLMTFMKDKPKPYKQAKYSGTLLASLLALLFEIIAYYVAPAFFFKTYPEVIIGSLCLAILINTYLMFAEVDKYKSEADYLLNTTTSKIIEQINFSKYFQEAWCQKIYTDIFDTVSHSRGHQSVMAKKVIAQSVDEARSFLGKNLVISFKYEYNRIAYLNAVYEAAEDYIWAVTIDVRNYFSIFWLGANDQYSELNVEAAKHVTIRRIFVIDDDILNHKRKDAKAQGFFSVIADLQRGGPNVHLYTIPMSVFLASDLAEEDTSFFLCDGVIASESGNSENSDNGYFCFEKEDVYQKLKNKFNVLKSMADEIKFDRHK